MRCAPAAAAALAIVLTLPWPRVAAQTPSAQFEVASVKANTSGEPFVRFGFQPGGRFVVNNAPLREIVRMAFQLQGFQLLGGPDWMGSSRFDINAKAGFDIPPGPAAFNTILPLVRGLLAERFNLKTHSETRQIPIYELVLARSDGKPGPKLRPAATDCAALMKARPPGGGPGLSAPPPPPPGPGEPMTCGMRMMPGNLAAGSTAITQLANNLSNMVGRMVVDKTGLSGNFDFELIWTPDRMPQGPPPPGAPPLPPIDPNGPSIFTALQEQLGLKLESRNGPVEVIVIDSVSQPTPD